jgi:hypothetical protein
MVSVILWHAIDTNQNPFDANMDTQLLEEIPSSQGATK